MLPKGSFKIKLKCFPFLNYLSKISFGHVIQFTVKFQITLKEDIIFYVNQKKYMG